MSDNIILQHESQIEATHHHLFRDIHRKQAHALGNVEQHSYLLLAQPPGALMDAAKARLQVCFCLYMRQETGPLQCCSKP